MDISSANAVLTITIPGLFPAPIQIQGFGTDDAFDTERVEIAQVVMGVDGRMSGGAVPVIKKQTITLQADSPSMLIFDAWVQAQNPLFGGTILPIGEILSIPSISTVFTLINGILGAYTPIPKGGKILGPRQFEISWQQVLPAPL